MERGDRERRSGGGRAQRWRDERLRHDKVTAKVIFMSDLADKGGFD